MSKDSRHCPDCGGSDGWHYIVYMTEQTDQEVIPPVQEAAQVVQAERFGSSISLLSLSAMVSMSYSEQSY